MFGWLSRARARASRANRSAKAHLALALLQGAQQDFEGDKPVQLRLPGFIDQPPSRPGPRTSRISSCGKCGVSVSGGGAGSGDGFTTCVPGGPRILAGNFGFRDEVQADQAARAQPVRCIGTDYGPAARAGGAQYSRDWPSLMVNREQTAVTRKMAKNNPTTPNESTTESAISKLTQAPILPGHF